MQLFRSIMEYGSPVWNNLGIVLSNELERLQKRAHRIIHGECNCIFPSLTNRRNLLSLKILLAAESDNQHPLHRIVPHRISRNRLFNIEHARTSRRQGSWMLRTCLYHNNKYHLSISNANN